MELQPQQLLATLCIAAKLIEINPVPQVTDKRQIMTKAIKTYQKQHQQAITTTQVLPKVKNAKIEIWMSNNIIRVPITTRQVTKGNTRIK